MPTVGSLNVDARLETAAFDRGRERMERGAQSIQQRFERLGSRMSSIGQTMSIGITAPFVALMSQAIPAAAESRQALGQVEAALRSMGAGAGRTSEQLQAAAAQLMSISTFDDDEILRKVTANLLTFGNVAGEVFDRAQLAVVNMAARMGTDLQSATMMLGRALNDPVRGMNALARSGIQFTDAQKAMIEQMVRTGDVAGAQRLMLTELERQFGGAAQALRAATPGADVQQAWGDFQETIGEIALRLLPPITRMLTSVLEAFNNLNPKVQEFAVYTAGIAAALGPVLFVLGPIISTIGTLAGKFGAAGAAATEAGAAGGAAATGGLATLARILPHITLAATAVYVAFTKWDEISGFVDRVAQRITATDEQLAQLNQRATEGRGAWDHFASSEAFQAHFFQRLEEDIGAIGRRFTEIQPELNRWQQWINETDAAIAQWASNTWRSFDQMWQGAVRSFHGIVEGARRWLVDGLSGIWSSVRQKLSEVGDYFQNLYVRVVGNSYIPDMVDEIGQHMRRLDQTLVQPAREATRSAVDAFRDMQAEVSQLMDRLFPEVRQRIELQADLRRIGRAGFTPEQEREARRRLYLQNGALDNVTPIDQGPEPTPIEQTVGEVEDALRDRRQAITGFFSDTFADGIMSALRGDFGGWFNNWWQQQFSDSLRYLFDQLGSMLQRAFQGLGSLGDATKGHTDFFGTLLQGFGAIFSGSGGLSPKKGSGQVFGSGFKVPGFANGGSFKIGGYAGIDQNLLSLNGSPIARVSRGEIMDVSRGGARSPVSFDLRGAVMTQDLLAQMQRMADGAVLTGGFAGSSLAQREIGRRSMRQLP